MAKARPRMRVEMLLDEEGIAAFDRVVDFMRRTEPMLTEGAVVGALLRSHVRELEQQSGYLWRWRALIERERAVADAKAKAPVLLATDLPAAERLGLVWPFRVADVERARRRLAKTQHPDAGDKTEAMRLTNEAADRLVARLREAGRP